MPGTCQNEIQHPITDATYSGEVMAEETRQRFAFGKNWQRYLQHLTPERIDAARRSLQETLGVADLRNKSFLDIGCGSGLFSLCAHQLGARVVSFDYDADSVACCRELQRLHAPEASDWTISQGSALDAPFLSSLGQFDVVYSWGVLHHTGDMWTAMQNVVGNVGPGGQLLISIYNDQGHISDRWKRVKRLYVRLPKPLQWLLVIGIQSLWASQRLLATGAATLARLLTLRNPLVPAAVLLKGLRQKPERGMSRWTDLVDWVGGWPFEVARPEEVFDFVYQRGFQLQRLRTCGGGLGCNEFLFRRD